MGCASSTTSPSRVTRGPPSSVAPPAARLSALFCWSALMAMEIVAMRSDGPVRTTRVACAVTKDSPGSGETKQSVGAAQLASLPRACS